MRTTYCLHNGKEENMTPFEIFDWRKYDTLHAVTFSCSKKFIWKYFLYYRQVDLTVGISNYSMQHTMQLALNQLNEYYKNGYSNPLSSDIKSEYGGATLRVPIHGVIHSKIYLLLNSVTGSIRVVTGSANLSEAAFYNSKDQYEEIIVSDLKSDYEKYMKRYKEDILPNTMPYLPKDVKQYLKKLGYFQKKNNK